ncbi:SDR family oxidoreductase [Nocardia sp. R6R-6]|uniref:SDR family oxidoreductase n=1 Tax=Nocardia sp. R6R-6 TaxID=3459303 RepID=UPI00403DD0C0
MSQSSVSLVVGGTSGIGAEVARQLAARGNVIVVSGSRTKEAADSLLTELGDPTYVQADMQDPECPEWLVAQVLEKHGRLDDVVYSAGATVKISHADLAAVTDEVWERVLSMNVVAPWRMVKAAAPALDAAGNGTITFVGALAGADVGGSSIPYAVSKAALHHMVKLLGAVVGPNIRINAVAPGLIETPWTSGEAWDQLYAHVRQAAPLKRVGRPEDVARLIVSLMGAEYTTGQTVIADGGLSLVP